MNERICFITGQDCILSSLRIQRSESNLQLLIRSQKQNWLILDLRSSSRRLLQWLDIHIKEAEKYSVQMEAADDYLQHFVWVYHLQGPALMQVTWSC